MFAARLCAGVNAADVRAAARLGIAVLLLSGTAFLIYEPLEAAGWKFTQPLMTGLQVLFVCAHSGGGTGWFVLFRGARGCFFMAAARWRWRHWRHHAHAVVQMFAS
jgi:hypothetical protein